jgi:predicted nucleic acid-binding protein
VTVYLDASALVKLVAREAETDALEAFLGKHDSHATSVVGLVEVRRAAARRGGVDDERVEQVLGRVTAIALDPGLVAAAGAVGPVGLRTLDAIHLASAALLDADLEALVTYDRGLADAALAFGLRCASPGETDVRTDAPAARHPGRSPGSGRP